MSILHNKKNRVNFIKFGLFFPELFIEKNLLINHCPSSKVDTFILFKRKEFLCQ